jgi:arsenate reductase
MAEGWARALKGNEVTPYSAGVAPKRLDPLAVRVMAEAGVDISGQRSKDVSEVMAFDPDVVVTVCDNARESCPVFPGATRVVHFGFEDPPALARDAGSEAEALEHYRRVRDEIKSFVETLPDALNEPDGGPF